MKIVSGSNFYIALKGNNTLWGWGLNFVSTDGNSIFGNRFNNDTFLVEPTLINDDNDWCDIAAGDNFFVAVKKTETEYLILGRGDNSYKQIGNQYYIDSDFLIIDRDDITNIQPEIKACGFNLYYNLLRTSLNTSGVWYGRGDNRFKQLLDDNNNLSIEKTDISTDENLVNNIVQIFIGNGYIIYKTKNNIYYGRGRNDNKQLNYNNQLQELGLTLLPLTGNFINMNLNSTTCVGITRDRKVYLWGNDYNSETPREPHEIFEDDEWEQVIVSEKAIIALNTEGTIYMYGELVT
jgi:alpha-tubulin suppressor-like RCC1 family protein